MGKVSKHRSASGQILTKGCLLLAVLLSLFLTGARASQANLELLPDAEQPPPGESLYLSVTLNEVATGKLIHAITHESTFFVPLVALQALSFRLEQQDAWLRLDEIKGVSAQYEQASQQLKLTADLALLSLDTQQLNARAAQTPKVNPGFGSVLNYDLFALRSDGLGKQLNGNGEFRVFGDWGLLTHSFLGFSDPMPGSKSFVRLNTSWRYSDPDDLMTWQLGDGVTRSLNWSRATRFAGVQWQRNFSLQPDLILYPLPQFLGQAALPSTVELYVNGVRQFQENVAPGPFEISALPNVNQLGEATLQVTDILGRQTLTSLPVYASSQMLAEGLTDYAVELGYVRENFGIDSYAYDNELMGMATVRHGLNDSFTIEAHGEASGALRLLGMGTVARLDELGIFSAALSVSDHAGARGRLSRLGYEWQSRYFGITMSTTRAQDDYRDVASLTGLPPAARAERVFLNFRMARYGTITTGYVHLDSPLTGKSRFGSLFYTLPIGKRLNLFATLTEDLDDSDRTSIFLGLNYAWRNISATASATRQAKVDRQALQVSRPVPIDGGLGWRASYEHAEQDHWQLDAGYRADFFEWGAGVSEFGGQRREFASLSGAVVAMDSALHLSRRIDDGFALVSSTGVPDVPVQLENRTIGRTNADGYYILTPVSSYQQNRISIDPSDLPEDVYFGPTHRKVVPADRAGVIADFGLQQRQAATLIVKSEKGEYIPVGSVAYLNKDRTASGYVGYDGQLYLQNLEDSNDLDIKIAGAGQCHLAFDYKHRPGTVPTLGPLVCR